MGDSLNLLNVGDIILGKNTSCFFKEVNPILHQGDIVVGQLEAPYTRRHKDSEKFERYPEYLRPLAEAEFDLVTLAGNHIMDAGRAGVEDTIDWLAKNNINYVGAGMDIYQAKKPAILEHRGTTVGYVNYNCVGPKESWAAHDKAGCSYLNVITHYELEHPTPGGPPSIYTWVSMDSLLEMKEAISKLKEDCDIVVAAFHKGIGHTPVKLAEYEHEASYAAIDAGADLVVGHHAHILKGIEFYNGKPIFHGLGNFITYLKVSTLRAGKHPEKWAEKRKELFGFEPDPEYPTYPFHPEAIYTLISKCVIREKQIREVCCVPLIVNKEGYPERLKNERDRKRFIKYMEYITESASLNASYKWDEEELMVVEKT